jgi:orotidine-5'-phosphate decarboxylase
MPVENLHQLASRERLIVALDVASVDDALRAVERLDNVSFFKIGLQLFITGGLPRLLGSLRHKHVFVDLKLPGDIANTITAVVDACVAMNVKMMTLSESMPGPAIAAATAARDAQGSAIPKFLTVPFLSSLDASDLQAEAGCGDLDNYILTRARRALSAGCDGIIASGQAIGLCRSAFPVPTLIVSPGVRPEGTSSDDHKRSTTPGEAIALGADFLVVGRPVLRHAQPRDAAERIIEQIEMAFEKRSAAAAPIR